MAVYSTNQNRQFYAASALGVSSHAPSLTNPGDIGVYHVGDGNDKQLYFVYKNPLGEIIKSDYIPLKNLDYIKPIKASSMVDLMKSVKVMLDNNVNSGAPLAGQDYLLRISFRQFYGMSDEDQYFKDIVVHATSAMSTAKDLFDAFVVAANKAFSREVGATASSNPYLAFAAAGSGDGGYLTITEKPQEWSLGTQAQERVYFDVYPTTIYTGGDDVIWGTVTDISATTNQTVKNGKKIADLEWFCMGERGDQYRYQGWPNYIPTTYAVDPSKEYSVLELHYAFTDTGVNSYRSEKDLIIAVPNGAAGHVYDVINAIIDEVEYHSGLTIAGLSD